jgi:hypothetical protein
VGKKLDSLLAKILVRHESCVKGKMGFIVKLASLTICETRNLQDSQTGKIIIHSEKLIIFARNSALWPIAWNEFKSRISRRNQSHI